MDIQEVVRESLSQICRGVIKANAQLENGGHGDSIFVLDSTRDEHGSYVDYDVAVTLKESDNGAGKGTLKLAVFEAGVSIGIGLSTETVSRIKFRVYLNNDIS